MWKKIWNDRILKMVLGIVSTLIVSGVTAIVTIAIEDHYGMEQLIKQNEEITKRIDNLVNTIKSVEKDYTTKEEFNLYKEEHYRLHSETFELLRSDLKSYMRNGKGR